MAVTALPLQPNEVSINNKIYTIIGEVQKRRANQWAPATRTGNPDLADQVFASELAWSDLTGGLGTQDMDERESPERYAHATMNTMSKYGVLPLLLPTAVTLPGTALSEAGGNSIVTQLESSVPYSYVISGTSVKRVNQQNSTGYYYDTGTSGWVTSGGTEYTLPAAASGPAIVWKGNVWVPCGASGLVRYSASGATFATIAVDAQLLFIFDEDLARITTAGVILSTDDNTTAPTWTTRAQIDTFSSINGVTVHRNSSGEPAPVVATDRGLLIIDWFKNRVYDMGISFSDSSSDNGKAMTTWDGDLWFGMRGNVHQVLNGAKVNRGPSTGDGIVRGWQGQITALQNGYDSFLAAAVDGKGQAQSGIYGYNKKGWHMLAAITTLPVGSASGQSVHTDLLLAAEYATSATSGAIAGAAPTYQISGGTMTWAAAVGTPTYSSGSIRCAGTAIATVDTTGYTAGDYTVKTVLTGISGSAVGGIVIRLTDSSNFWIFRRASATAYELVEVVAGVETVRGTYTTAPAAGDVLAVTGIGTTIKCYVNQQLAITYASASSNSTATKCGVGSKTNVASTFGGIEISFPCHRPLALSKAPGRTGRPSNLIWTSTLVNSLYLLPWPDETDRLIDSTNLRFVTDGEWITPWFDAGLRTVEKTFLNAEISLRNWSYGGTSVGGTVKIFFQTTPYGTWTQMYDVSGSATTFTVDGAGTAYFDTARLGNLYRRVRFKVVRTGGSSLLIAPIIEYLRVRYLREMPVLYGFDFQIDLNQWGHDGRSPDQQIEDLESDVGNRLLVDFAYQTGQSADSKLVFILSYAGPHRTGTDKTAMARVSLVEITPNTS